jgi:hypothetical protein
MRLKLGWVGSRGWIAPETGFELVRHSHRARRFGYRDRKRRWLRGRGRGTGRWKWDLWASVTMHQEAVGGYSRRRFSGARGSDGGGANDEVRDVSCSIKSDQGLWSRNVVFVRSRRVRSCIGSRRKRRCQKRRPRDEKPGGDAGVVG